MKRPELTKKLDSCSFQKYYYLKAELIDFCRSQNLSTKGSKLEITNRIIVYLDTGSHQMPIAKKKPIKIHEDITLDTIIEKNFVCSQKHRAFFQQHIGQSFSFHVAFQNWLKTNAGKTYRDAIDAYHQLLAFKKKQKTNIDPQFEYNTYIRDFFANNKGKTLDDAILCWKYKKSLPGHHHYEEKDLEVL